MTTRIGGSSVPPDCAPGGAPGLGVGVSPAAGAGDAGVVVGASLPGDGAVCAKAPAQIDEIRSDVEASSRGRNDTDAPCQANFHDAFCASNGANQRTHSRRCHRLLAPERLPGDWDELAQSSVTLSIIYHTIAASCAGHYALRGKASRENKNAPRDHYNRR